MIDQSKFPVCLGDTCIVERVGRSFPSPTVKDKYYILIDYKVAPREGVLKVNSGLPPHFENEKIEAQ